LDRNTGDPKSDVDVKEMRGGVIISAGIIALLMKDFAVKVAIMGLFGSTIWSDTSDNMAEHILRYGSSICAVPGRKLKKIIKKLQGLDDRHTLDIKEILLEKNISNKEKLELLRLKIAYAMKNLTGKKGLFLLVQQYLY
jgi:hypothetical protein